MVQPRAGTRGDRSTESQNAGGVTWHELAAQGAQGYITMPDSNSNSNTPVPPPYLTESLLEAAWLCYRRHRVVVGADIAGHCGFAFPDTPELQSDVTAFASDHVSVEQKRYEAVKKARRRLMDEAQREAREGGDFDTAARQQIARERERNNRLAAQINPGIASLQRTLREGARVEWDARLRAVSRAQRVGLERPAAPANGAGEGE